MFKTIEQQLSEWALNGVLVVTSSTLPTEALTDRDARLGVPLIKHSRLARRLHRGIPGAQDLGGAASGAAKGDPRVGRVQGAARGHCWPSFVLGSTNSIGFLPA